VVARDQVLDVAAPMTTIFMIAPPSEADEWRMDHTELQNFQATSNLPWVFVQGHPMSLQYLLTREAPGDIS
jgi:hypothetical protein